MAYTTINKPNTYFNTLTWTGTGSSSGRSFTGVGFKPDLVWQKVRGTTYGHWIADAIRGSGKRLASNTNNAEESNSIYGYLTTFDTDGFTTVAGSTDNTGWNETSQTYVAWNWLGANTTVSNTQGSITSTVSANTTSGFSIFTYTGTGASTTTVGHGCSSEPKLVIVKNRSGTGAWVTYHYGAGATGLGNPNQASLILNGTNASANPASGGYLSDGYFSNVNSTTITLRDVNNANNVNATSNNYVGYAFAEVKGFSKFGSYTGNGSTDGTFVYTGFKPAFVIIKRDYAGYDWLMFDNKRQTTFNVIDDFLYADLSDAEVTGNANQAIDFVSNGFKCRGTGGSTNGSGGTFFYMAFAEQPLVGTNNVPATAR